MCCFDMRTLGLVCAHVPPYSPCDGPVSQPTAAPIHRLGTTRYHKVPQGTEVAYMSCRYGTQSLSTLNGPCKDQTWNFLTGASGLCKHVGCAFRAPAARLAGERVPIHHGTLPICPQPKCIRFHRFRPTRHFSVYRVATDHTELLSGGHVLLWLVRSRIGVCRVKICLPNRCVRALYRS